MSEEMAVGDNASQEPNILNSIVACKGEMEATVTDETSEVSAEVPATEPESITESTKDEAKQGETQEFSIKNVDVEMPIKKDLEIKEESTYEIEPEQQNADVELSRGMKRRASAAFSDEGDEDFKGFDNSVKYEFPEYGPIVEEERRVKSRIATSNDDGFKGFNLIECNNLTGYCQVLERLEAEVSAAVKSYTPLRSVMAAPAFRASKRARQDTDGSRPSSALSTRSDGEGAISTDASSSPAGRGRRTTVEMSSPLLRVPLDRGWKRELVYRASGATSDSHNRRNADIYYYTPSGKKLRSTREVSEQLSGTGLTLENFSFFKEPLGVDDPEKEIIRDAKVMRRVESPIPSAPITVVDSKRTPKPKPPKGASPEPATPKSPPAKIKVKLMGARLSSNGTTTTTTTPKAKKPSTQQPPPPPAVQQPAPPADNNNTAAWKKPRGPPSLQPRPAAPPPHVLQHPPHAQLAQVPRQTQQPCSMTCGRGAVPSLACNACLCLYHPICVGFTGAVPERFLCKNCRNPSSPPALDPPPLMHKSGVTSTGPHQITSTQSLLVNVGNQGARRLPVPVPVPVPAKVPRNDKRVLLRMKVAGGGPDGERVWSVSKPGGPPTPPVPPSPVPVPAAPPVCRPALPQSLAILNGRRFIVVSRALHQ